jgi:NADP-dependent 3-hydroxy acid dehydrogenase YdfG
MSIPRASVAIVGAGDFVGADIAKRFVAAGFSVHGGRRQGEKLASLKAEIEAAGGKFTGHTLDARPEESVAGGAYGSTLMLLHVKADGDAGMVA